MGAHSPHRSLNPEPHVRRGGVDIINPKEVAVQVEVIVVVVVLVQVVRSLAHGHADDGDGHAAVGGIAAQAVFCDIGGVARGVGRAQAAVDMQRIGEIVPELRRVFGGIPEILQRADIHHDMPPARVRHQKIADPQFMAEQIKRNPLHVQLVAAVQAAVGDHLLQRIVLRLARLEVDPVGKAGAVKAVNVSFPFDKVLRGFRGVPDGHQLVKILAAEHIGQPQRVPRPDIRARDFVIACEERVAFLQHRERGVQLQALLDKRGRGNDAACKRQNQKNRERSFHARASENTFYAIIAGFYQWFQPDRLFNFNS